METPRIIKFLRGGGRHSRRSLGGHYFSRENHGKCDCGLTLEEYKI